MTDKDEIISAFAFRTGKQIEQLVKDTTGDLFDANQKLEAKILGWWVENGRDEKYAEYFGIKTARDGKINR
jgi:hypothetical protein